MAIIAPTSIPSHVQGAGDAKSATVSLSGSIMEMLATVYSHILMSAIREAIQNGCDAARRAGLSFAEGVLVELPTAENPVITISDKGSGMTKEFMEAEDGYLSFGTSTKVADDDSAGGLGVGRWAAYGYIRECTVATTHASDMMEHCYFQFQGSNDMPQVAPAVSRPGTRTGTIVSFPVHLGDIEEAHRAVAWLKDVMQLTMGDSFSVDAPAALAAATATATTKLPGHSGIILDLEPFDPMLKGVRVYPMLTNNLQYSPKELTTGSLVVLTNQKSGVGGLPFHVKTSGMSAFGGGMIIEIPMSFRVPFMPSREELKYTSKVNALMEAIDAATQKAAVAKVKELYEDKSLSAKKTLNRFIGSTVNHFVAAAMRGGKSDFGAELVEAGGRSAWTGAMQLEGFDESLRTTPRLRHRDSTLSKGYTSGGRMFVPQPGGKAPERVSFNVMMPPTLVANDLDSGGLARFREWAMGQEGMLVLVSGENPADAIEQVKKVNSHYGNELKTLKTSDFPAAAKRVIKGASVVRATKTTMLFHSLNSRKQETAVMSYLSAEPGVTKVRPRIWVGKEGRALAGLSDSASFAALLEAGLDFALSRANVDRVYFFSKKEVQAFETLVNSVKESGAWDMPEEEFAELDIGMSYGELQTLKLWIPLETALGQLTEAGAIKRVLDGLEMHTVHAHAGLTMLLENLGKRPRLELTGTKLDKALAPYFDALTGAVKLPVAKLDHPLHKATQAMQAYGEFMEIADTDPEERKALKARFVSLAQCGRLVVSDIYEDLCAKFPLLRPLSAARFPDSTLDQYTQALAMVCR
ncbi:ATP-binding protein [Achromobacter xylosoxidans]